MKAIDFIVTTVYLFSQMNARVPPDYFHRVSLDPHDWKWDGMIIGI